MGADVDRQLTAFRGLHQWLNLCVDLHHRVFIIVML